MPKHKPPFLPLPPLIPPCCTTPTITRRRNLHPYLPSPSHPITSHIPAARPTPTSQLHFKRTCQSLTSKLPFLPLDRPNRPVLTTQPNHSSHGNPPRTILSKEAPCENNKKLTGKHKPPDMTLPRRTRDLSGDATAHEGRLDLNLFLRRRSSKASRYEATFLRTERSRPLFQHLLCLSPTTRRNDRK
jgi:hypothetical protein